ncbi:MAG: hypothetical protein M1133_08685 [Armatimonadetes bacterium]|nr:hypothetical protein [Armatimonadota bacterium]
MKRYAMMLFALAVLLALSAGASHAVYPVPDGCQTFKLQQGWAGPGIPVWYIGTDTSDIRFATTQHLRLSPDLRRGFYGAGVAAMFIVCDPPASQGPIFETVPGKSLYSGIWRVREVKWIDLSARVPLISIGQILALKAAGKLDYTETEIRVDFPIIAVGRLGFPADPPFQYVVPQAKDIDIKKKTVVLPFWKVYCADSITKYISIERVIIPDAGTMQLAFDLGANYAPMLQKWGNSAFQLAGTQRFAVFVGPQPVNQYPVIENCPPDFPTSNSEYTPVGRLTIIQRNIAPWTVLKTPDVIKMYLHTGGLVVLDEKQFINCPVVCSNMIAR